jgi:hypothetical protein
MIVLETKSCRGEARLIDTDLIIQAAKHMLFVGAAMMPPSSGSQARHLLPPCGRRTKTSITTCRKPKLPSPDVGRRVGDESSKRNYCFLYLTKKIRLSRSTWARLAPTPEISRYC